jgi:hypothetical protein
MMADMEGENAAESFQSAAGKPFGRTRRCEIFTNMCYVLRFQERVSERQRNPIGTAGFYPHPNE